MPTPLRWAAGGTVACTTVARSPAAPPSPVTPRLPVTLRVMEATEVPFDERLLVERARSDPDSFDALYRAYVGRIHAFAWRRTGSRHAAEDITSATFERALRHLDTFRWRGGGFGPWLFRIAANAVTDHHRAEAQARSPRGQLALASAAPTAGPDPADTVPGDDPELRQALGRLNPRYQEALSLRFLGGLELADVATALGVSKATAAVVVSRAAAALRRELGRDDRPEAPPATPVAAAIEEEAQDHG